MPEGEILKFEVRAGPKEGSEESENGTKEHESLPDDALSEGPAESRGVCVVTRIISSWPEADVFFDPHTGGRRSMISRKMSFRERQDFLRCTTCKRAQIMRKPWSDAFRGWSDRWFCRNIYKYMDLLKKAQARPDRMYFLSPNKTGRLYAKLRAVPRSAQIMHRKSKSRF